MVLSKEVCSNFLQCFMPLQVCQHAQEIDEFENDALQLGAATAVHTLDADN